MTGLMALLGNSRLISSCISGHGWHCDALLVYKTAINKLYCSSFRTPKCYAFYACGNLRPTSKFKQNSHLLKLTKNSSTSALDVNTKVAKDVILFKYDNPKFFIIVNIFAISQFCFWSYLSHFAFTTMKDAPPKEVIEDTPWWRKINLGENKYRNGLTILSFLIGYGILATAWLFTLRSVRYLVLRKGGDQVTFVTYTPFGKNRMMTVDLNKISCEDSRHTARVQLPIKVKNHRLFYVLDMKGEFRNPKLFDYTAGLKRTLKD